MQAHHKLDTHSSIILQVGEEAAVLVVGSHFIVFLVQLIYINFSFHNHLHTKELFKADDHS